MTSQAKPPFNRYFNTGTTIQSKKKTRQYMPLAKQGARMASIGGMSSSF